VANLRTKTGTRLTRRRVQDLAAEAERGYDLSRARQEKVRGGRPSLEEGVSPPISYRVGEGRQPIASPCGGAGQNLSRLGSQSETAGT